MLSDIHSHMLSAGPVADPTLRPEDVAGSQKRQLLITAFRQLDSISQRDTNLMLVKALHNMESTAFFINYMLQVRGFILCSPNVLTICRGILIFLCCGKRWLMSLRGKK